MVKDAVVERPRRLAPDIPAELEQIILKALAKRPIDRFQTAEELSEQLNQVLVSKGQMVGHKRLAEMMDKLFRDRRGIKDDQIQVALTEESALLPGVAMTGAASASLQISQTVLARERRRGWPLKIAAMAAAVVVLVALGYLVYNAIPKGTKQGAAKPPPGEIRADRAAHRLGHTQAPGGEDPFPRQDLPNLPAADRGTSFGSARAAGGRSSRVPLRIAADSGEPELGDASDSQRRKGDAKTVDARDNTTDSAADDTTDDTTDHAARDARGDATDPALGNATAHAACRQTSTAHAPAKCHDAHDPGLSAMGNYMGAKRPNPRALAAVTCPRGVLLALALALALTLPLPLPLALTLTRPRPRPRRANAQTAEDKARATAYFKQGGKAYTDGRYLEAVRLFKSAYKSLKHRSISFNIALSYEKAQLAIEAAKWTRIYQVDGRIPDAKLPPELKRALTKVGVLVVVALRRGTLVFVDGHQAGVSPLRKLVLPGRRKIELRVGSKVIFRRVVRLDGGKTVRVAQERIRVRPRVLTRRRVSKRPRERVGPGLNPQPGDPPTRRSLLGRLHWGWFTAAVTVTVSALVGAVVMSKKTLDSFHELKLPVSQRPSGFRDRLDREQQLTNVLWGISGAAAVGAALIAVFTHWRGRGKEKANRIIIGPTITRPGVQIQARW